MAEILNNYESDPPISESQNKDLDKILIEAEAYYKKKGLI